MCVTELLLFQHPQKLGFNLNVKNRENILQILNLGILLEDSILSFSSYPHPAKSTESPKPIACLFHSIHHPLKNPNELLVDLIF